MGNVKIVNSVVLLSLFSLTSGSRLSPWCHGQVTTPYRQVTIVQRSHGMLIFLDIQFFGFLSITRWHWDHVWTGPLKFLNERIFFVCATRLIATMQILLLCCLHGPVQIFATFSIRMDFFFFYQKHVTLVKTFWDTRGNNSYSTS